jgi:histidyl-tRNA synthetase
LDEDSVRRLEGNPLRILDSKNPALREVIANAPVLHEFFDQESRQHFEGLQRHLDAVGIKYVVNPRLVRGLDYYSHTVFEWITTELGAQDAVCSGGRYDGLVAQLGGKLTPAIGWALGQERLVELLQLQNGPVPPVPADVYFVISGERAQAEALGIAERLRDQLPAVRLHMNCGGGSFKSQLKRADESGAAFAVILGDDEVGQGVVGLKSLRVEAAQVTVAWDKLADELRVRLAHGRPAQR